MPTDEQAVCPTCGGTKSRPRAGCHHPFHPPTPEEVRGILKEAGPRGPSGFTHPQGESLSGVSANRVQTPEGSTEGSRRIESGPASESEERCGGSGEVNMGSPAGESRAGCPGCPDCASESEKVEAAWGDAKPNPKVRTAASESGERVTLWREPNKGWVQWQTVPGEYPIHDDEGAESCVFVPESRALEAERERYKAERRERDETLRAEQAEQSLSRAERDLENERRQGENLLRAGREVEARLSRAEAALREIEALRPGHDAACVSIARSCLEDEAKADLNPDASPTSITGMRTKRPWRRCPRCLGVCHWHDTDWVCDHCGDEWNWQHNAKFAAPGDTRESTNARRKAMLTSPTERESE